MDSEEINKFIYSVYGQNMSLYYPYPNFNTNDGKKRKKKRILCNMLKVQKTLNTMVDLLFWLCIDAKVFTVGQEYKWNDTSFSLE